MKRLLSIVLCLAMIFSLSITTTFADDEPIYSTTVTYTGTGTESYTVTVPSSLAPGASGNVTVSGTWGSDRVVKVSADSKVTLTNSINSADTKDLDITFTPIAKVGNNKVAIAGTEADAKSTVSVATISNALFGTWSGTFNYNTSIEDYVEPVVAGAYFGDTFLTWDKLQDSANGTTYGYDASLVSDTEIGDGAFIGCSALTSLTLPASIESIGEAAFAESNLESVTLQDGLKNIGPQVFIGCFGLESVTLPDTLESIGYNAFVSCSLKSIEFPDSLKHIDMNAFACNRFTSITLPDNIEFIGAGAFENCDSLSSVTYKGIEYTSEAELRSVLAGNDVTIDIYMFRNTALTDQVDPKAL